MGTSLDIDNWMREVNGAAFVKLAKYLIAKVAEHGSCKSMSTASSSLSTLEY